MPSKGDVLGDDGGIPGAAASGDGPGHKVREKGGKVENSPALPAGKLHEARGVFETLRDGPGSRNG